MMAFGDSSDDYGVSPELERQRAKLEEQRDMYRGDNIDHLIPEDAPAPLAKGIFTNNSHESDGNDSHEDENEAANDHTKNYAVDSQNIKIVNNDIEDTGIFVAEPLSPTTTNSAHQPTVLLPKMHREFTFPEPLWGFLESDYQPIPAPGWPTNTPEDAMRDDRYVPEQPNNLNEDDQNLGISQFIKQIYLIQKRYHHQTRLEWPRLHPNGPAFSQVSFVEYLAEAVYVDGWEVNDHIMVPEKYDHIDQPPFDLQQLDWGPRTGLTEAYSRELRDQMYRYYRGERDTEIIKFSPLNETHTSARFNPQSMHTKHRASTPHFQLRNQFAVQDHLRYIYSNGSGSQVWSEYNWSSDRIKVMDFSKVTYQDTFAQPVSISTLSLSNDHPRSVCMIGGLDGEFAYKSLLSEDDAIATGFATTNRSGGINHIDLDYHNPRQSHHAVISCNDSKIRILDLHTGIFLSSSSKPKIRNGTETGHAFDFAINCTATCPDGRLRVAVGDCRKPKIIRAEDSGVERELVGHADYGFACAWSPDARYVATAAHDRVVNVYDTRTWRILSTFSPYASTYRSMKFSPVGGGTRCLLLAEEADRVTIVNAHTFTDAQTHSFYGSIVGCDFEPDGKGFWVANSDEKFGGFMRYERTGQGQEYGLSITQQGRTEAMGDGFEEEGPEEWIEDERRVFDAKCVNPRRHGEKLFRY